MKTREVLFVLISVLLAFTACKKEEIEDPEPDKLFSTINEENSSIWDSYGITGNITWGPKDNGTIVIRVVSEISDERLDPVDPAYCEINLWQNETFLLASQTGYQEIRMQNGAFRYQRDFEISNIDVSQLAVEIKWKFYDATVATYRTDEDATETKYYFPVPAEGKILYLDENANYSTFHTQYGITGTCVWDYYSGPESKYYVSWVSTISSSEVNVSSLITKASLLHGLRMEILETNNFYQINSKSGIFYTDEDPNELVVKFEYTFTNTSGESKTIPYYIMPTKRE